MSTEIDYQPQRHRPAVKMPEDRPPPPAPEPREPWPPPGPRMIRARSKAVKDLTVDVECTHLVGLDVAVIRRKDWLSDVELFDLGERREQHHQLVDEVDKADSAVRALREQVAQERKTRTAQLAEGTAAGRPRPDGAKLIAEAEELAVAAVARLIAFGDETLGLIRGRMPAWKAELAQRDAATAQTVEEARRALARVEAQATETHSAKVWAAGQSRMQVVGWTDAKQVKPKPPPDPEAARRGGWA